MKLAILGATGQTGLFLVNQALQQGHEVTALVRNVSKITIQHENLKVVESNIFSSNSLSEHFKGQDAIMSCLGFPYKTFSSISGYTDSMAAIVTAMRQSGVNKMVTMTSWYTGPGSGQNASFFVRNLLIPLIRSVLNNMYEMEQYLEKDCSDINWTVVRPPGLQNNPATEKEILIHEGFFVPDDKGNAVTNTVARGDVARFMLSVLNDAQWTRKIIAMCCKD
ncbi:flavin reductase (NADPH)-like [Spea bombifrons]|uniref:flavin reductase (NADPH)-like n=1 Tax=Spea bombifrons TaxID=233779 RepID=UPI002349C5D2|nr:flavin reductase (NADPH)-like [Spea bombifrons]